MTRDDRPRLAPKARLRADRATGGMMLLAPEKGLALNATAAAALELCDGARSVAAICEELSARFGRDAAAIEGDVLPFFTALRDRGLLA